MEPPKPVVSIVLPVHNEAKSLPAMLERLRSLLDSDWGKGAEILFIDDHSSDNSPAILASACGTQPRCRYLRLAKNSGSHVAILAGLEHAQGDCAVFLASDLQDPPELIPRMLELWRAGNHVVWAVRERRDGISWAENFFARTFYFLLIKLARVDLPPQGSDFALLDRAVIDALLQSVGAEPSLGGEIARLGFCQTQIPYIKERRQFGRSSWTLGRKLKAFADAFVAFSYVPLRAMSYLGILCSLLGFVYALLIVVLWLFCARAGQGWPSLMVVILLLGGMQMTMLGVLGEYLWRTLGEARRRPRYFLERPASQTKRK